MKTSEIEKLRDWARNNFGPTWITALDELIEARRVLREEHEGAKLPIKEHWRRRDVREAFASRIAAEDQS